MLVRMNPLSGLVIFTSTDCITPPVGSLTVPWTVPAPPRPCADANAADAHIDTNTTTPRPRPRRPLKYTTGHLLTRCNSRRPPKGGRYDRVRSEEDDGRSTGWGA